MKEFDEVSANEVYQAKKKYKKLNSTILDKIKEFKNKRALEKAWSNRNLDHGDVLMDSLELDCFQFQQNIFVEETPELVQKLERIGFKPLYGFPDEKKFEGFSRIMYHSKHNVAFSLYKHQDANAIYTAIEIIEKSIVDEHTALVVFLNAIDVLKNPSTKKPKVKQILMEKVAKF